MTELLLIIIIFLIIIIVMLVNINREMPQSPSLYEVENYLRNIFVATGGMKALTEERKWLLNTIQKELIKRGLFKGEVKESIEKALERNFIPENDDYYSNILGTDEWRLVSIMKWLQKNKEEKKPESSPST